MEYLKPSLETLGNVAAIVLGDSQQGTPDAVLMEGPILSKPNDIAAGLDD